MENITSLLDFNKHFEITFHEIKVRIEWRPIDDITFMNIIFNYLNFEAETWIKKFGFKIPSNNREIECKYSIKIKNSKYEIYPLFKLSSLPFKPLFDCEYDIYIFYTEDKFHFMYQFINITIDQFKLILTHLIRNKNPIYQIYYFILKK